jgi:maltose O-acetyltransferase
MSPLTSLARLARRAWPRISSMFRLLWVRIANTGENLTVGSRTLLGPGFKLRLAPGGRVKIGDRVRFRQGCTLEVGANAELTIGDDTVMTFGVVVQCAHEVTIGSGCMFGNGASVADNRHEYGESRDGMAETPLVSWPIEIGDGVWISSHTTVASSVGFGSIIGAQSLVSKPVPARVLAFGTPATVRQQLQ